MPVDSILVSVAVFAMFAIFAGVLFWGDLQTTRSIGQTADRNRKRRPF